jgi:hypothetical protein
MKPATQIHPKPPRGRCWIILGAAVLSTACTATSAFADGRPFHIVVPVSQTSQERALTAMLLEESARRAPSGHRAVIATSLQPTGSDDILVVAQRAQIARMLSRDLRKAWFLALHDLHPTDRPEGFAVVSLPWRGVTVTIVAGNDQRGELFGAGWVLRQMRFATGTATIPVHLRTFQAPDKPVRGHQIGYRFKNNTYDAWTLPQFEQHIRDLAIFGTNTIQLIAPKSDDAPTSPLYPAPALDTVLGISAILQKYGLDCDLYYPDIRPDYTKPEQAEAELKDFEALVRAMPRLDALYVPGGDPGHTPPDVLFPLLEKQAAIVRRYHPHATVWLSAQGFDRARYETFYALMAKRPKWLTGIFFGPQSRDSFRTQRTRIPAEYPMQFYPDIAHTMHAQFPIPAWDPIFALTEGREPIDPRPAAFAGIYRFYAPLNTGFVTYSEGENDDVDKMLFGQLGWSSTTSVETLLHEYARWFLHREGQQEQLAVEAMQGLEENWNGPIATNTHILKTYALFQQLEQASTPRQASHNPQWEALLYRATYDVYVQRKLARERTAQQAALTALDAPGEASTRVTNANNILAASTPDTQERIEHDRLFALAADLFHDWGMQLSVKLYGASNWERGTNLDRVDTPLTGTVWLRRAMDEALHHPGEPDRLEALHRIAHWATPTPGAIYDDLGDPTAEPHLAHRALWQDDPAMYGTAIDGIADRTLADGWRLSFLDYAETLYETPLELNYRGLDPHRAYRIRITYAGEDYALPLRLTANGTIEIHPSRLRKSNPETVEFPIPQQAVATGELHLRWSGPEGSGGSGRGRQVAEVWLLPQP